MDQESYSTCKSDNFCNLLAELYPDLVKSKD